MSETTAQPSDKPLGFIDAEPAQPVAPSKEERKKDDAGASRSDRARGAGYHSRFIAVYVGLALVAGLGVGALVASMLRDDNAPAKAATAGAEFTPSRVGELGAIELARSVERKYRLANGEELTGVVASHNTLQDGQGGFYRVGYQFVQPIDSTGDGDTKVVRPEKAVQYSLCGANAQCAIPGTASITRFGLLKRQGLELAVRTFQNDSSVDNVAVFLRPVPPADPSWEGYTMVFNRDELNRNEPGLLSRPLGETLQGDAKTITPSQLAPAQLKKIDELTRGYTYQYRYQILGGRDALLQLQPTKN